MNKYDSIPLSIKQARALAVLEKTKYVKQVLYGGGAGSGKSYLGCFWQIERRLAHEGTNGFIGRKTLKDLKDTTLMTFQRMVNDFYPDQGISYDFQKNRIIFPNGNIIFLGYTAYNPSDPEYARLGGLEITDAFVDEAAESPKRSIEILSSRIRYNLVDNMPRLLMATNPALGWMKETWIKDKTGKLIKLPKDKYFVPALIDDNPDKDFVKTYKSTLSMLSVADQQRLLYGDWDYIQNDSPFITEFNEDNQVGDFQIDENYPLWFTFDFNIDPTTALVFQDRELIF